MPSSVSPGAEKHPQHVSRVARILRFIGYWIGFSGVYGSVSACPFCGRPGCPSGVAWTGVVGAVLALFTLRGGKRSRPLKDGCIEFPNDQDCGGIDKQHSMCADS